MPASPAAKNRMKKPDALRIAIEKGTNGYQGAWCLELPGCQALVPPGADPVDRIVLAVLQFAAWAHNRPAELLAQHRDHITVAQVLETGADIAAGETRAFFLHDHEPASPNEYPIWANAHDLAADELQALVASWPGMLLDFVGRAGRSVREIVDHAGGMELVYGARLRGGQPPSHTDLRAAHRWAQEMVCAVPPGHQAQAPDGSRWSLRRVMRESIWHLRFHAEEARRTVGELWLAPSGASESRA